jgi:hypothetical protein
MTGAQRYAVQFTASQEYADLIERAKALLSHTGRTSLEELHLRALQCLVAHLEKRKYGAPRKEVESTTQPETPKHMATNAEAANRFGVAAPEAALRERSRHVPMRIRRRVFERDNAQCTFVDDGGCRCRERERLELHHLNPFALAGQHHADNLTLRCQAHNALAAEQDFGRESIGKKRDTNRHESLRSQPKPDMGKAAGP